MSTEQTVKPTEATEAPSMPLLLCEDPARQHDPVDAPLAAGVVSDSSGMMRTLRLCRDCMAHYALNTAQMAIGAIEAGHSGAVAITISPLPVASAVPEETKP